MNESFTIDGNSVIVSKEEYESLTRDSVLADLTRSFLQSESGDYAPLEKLRFIYGVPARKEEE